MSTTIERHEDWIDPEVDLIGVDGNAWVVIGTVENGLRGAGNSGDVVDTYRKEAMAGDYDHLLQVSMLYAGMV